MTGPKQGGETPPRVAAPSAPEQGSCPLCGQTHVRGDVVALGRFQAVGAYAYRTADGAMHPTREAGQEWLCKRRLLPGERSSAGDSDA